MFGEEEDAELQAVVEVGGVFSCGHKVLGYDKTQHGTGVLLFSNKGKKHSNSRFEPVGPTSDCCQCFT